MVNAFAHPCTSCNLAYLEDDRAATHVLVLDELDGVIPLLVGCLAEKLGKAGQGLILAVKEGALQIENYINVTHS